MLMPVRCLSCGRPVSNRWEKYKEEVAKGKSPEKVLDELGIKNYCCRSLFLTHVDLIDNIAVFKKRIVPKPEEVREAEIRVIAPPIEIAPDAEETPEAEGEEEEEEAAAPKAERKKK